MDDDLLSLFPPTLGMSAGVGDERDEDDLRHSLLSRMNEGVGHANGASGTATHENQGDRRGGGGQRGGRGTQQGGRNDNDRRDGRGKTNDRGPRGGGRGVRDINSRLGDRGGGGGGDLIGAFLLGANDDGLHLDDGHHDEEDGEEEIEQQEWPSPAELLADTRSVLGDADAEVLREGVPPPPERMARLDRELHRIVNQQRTTPQDDAKRQNLLRRFNALLAHKFPGVSLQPFGSYVSVFHTASSDIDISLEVSPSSHWYDAKEMGPAAAANGGRGQGRRRQQQPRGYKSRKVQLLSKVASELRYQKFSDVQLIAHARVPLIKFRDPNTGVNCDVCVGNDGVYKSAVLGALANLDPRYRDLVFLVKMWAKNFDCNDATAGTFNSFALSLMSLFHLQTRSPPILPPALRLTLTSDAAADADLAAENERAANLEPIRKFPVSKIRQQSDALRDIGTVEARSQRWQGCGANNPATLAELLVTFFTHFRAVEPLWRHGLVASTYAGRWVAGSSWAPGRYCLGVEDPFAAGDNVARAVQRRSLPKVLAALRDGTLAVSRVVWAETDEELERALFNLLGPGAIPPPEVSAQGWPALNGRGGGDTLFNVNASVGVGVPAPPPGPPPRMGGQNAGLGADLLSLLNGPGGGGGGDGDGGGPLGGMGGGGMMPGLMQQLAQQQQQQQQQSMLQQQSGMGMGMGMGMRMGGGRGDVGAGGAMNLNNIFGGSGGLPPPGFGQTLQQHQQQQRGLPPGFGGPALEVFSNRGPASGQGGEGIGGPQPQQQGMGFVNMPSLFGQGPMSAGVHGEHRGIEGGDAVDKIFSQLSLGSVNISADPFGQSNTNMPQLMQQQTQAQKDQAMLAEMEASLLADDIAADISANKGGAVHGGGGKGGSGRRNRSRGGGGSGGGRGGGKGQRGGNKGGGGNDGGGSSGGGKTLPKPRPAPSS